LKTKSVWAEARAAGRANAGLAISVINAKAAMNAFMTPLHWLPNELASDISDRLPISLAPNCCKTVAPELIAVLSGFVQRTHSYEVYREIELRIRGPQTKV
jgi:hypothetical protein